MAETFGFAREGRRYIVFYRFGPDDLPAFLAFLGARLGVETDAIETIGGFARTAAFRFRDRDYTAVAGDGDECHVVAPDEAARIALIDAIFGAGASSDRQDHAVSPDA